MREKFCVCISPFVFCSWNGPFNSSCEEWSEFFKGRLCQGAILGSYDFISWDQGYVLQQSYARPSKLFPFYSLTMKNPSFQVFFVLSRPKVLTFIFDVIFGGFFYTFSFNFQFFQVLMFQCFNFYLIIMKHFLLVATAKRIWASLI